MKPTSALIAAATALTLPAAALAEPVTLTAKVRDYWGPPAYLAFYLTDANGQYVRTLYVAGGEARYWKHLRGWTSGLASSGQGYGGLNGLTGASIGGGRTLQVTVDVAQSLIDAGYQIRVDSAVEHQGEAPADAAVTLAKANAGKAVAGRGFVSSFNFSL